MEPTYSFPEIKSLVRSLDVTSITILADLVAEEKDFYTLYEYRAITRFIAIINKQPVINEVKAEYLLSFN